MSESLPTRSDFEVTRLSYGSLLGHETIHVELTCHADQGPHRPPYDTWAVRQRPWCLNAALEWEFEPLPSSRDDDFLKRCRFTKDEALELAAAYVAEHEAVGR